MICPFEKNMESPGAAGPIRNIFMTTAIIQRILFGLNEMTPMATPDFPLPPIESLSNPVENNS
jgi:hypothetical protein